MARFMATAMASAYRARPHWGKICPLNTEEIAPLYPALPRFRAHCASIDPDQAFINDFARRVLGF
jgi:xylitol oxidase